MAKPEQSGDAKLNGLRKRESASCPARERRANRRKSARRTPGQEATDVHRPHGGSTRVRAHFVFRRISRLLAAPACSVAACRLADNGALPRNPADAIIRS